MTLTKARLKSELNDAVETVEEASLETQTGNDKK